VVSRSSVNFPTRILIMIRQNLSLTCTATTDICQSGMPLASRIRANSVRERIPSLR
jgi:hypothetical protein